MTISDLVQKNSVMEEETALMLDSCDKIAVDDEEDAGVLVEMDQTTDEPTTEPTAAAGNRSDDVVFVQEDKGLETLESFDLVNANENGDDTEIVAQEKSSRRMSVTIDRKQVLLLQARASRTEWIEKVPLPYRQHQRTENGPLQTLQSSHVAKELPSALDILSNLYGIKDEPTADLLDRLQSVLGAHFESDKLAQLTAEDVVRSELEGEENSLVKDYHSFSSHLQDPACAMLVQGMRNFCRKLGNVTDKDEVSARLQSYCMATYSSLSSHAAWKKDGPDERTKRALEAFIYGQCYSHIEMTFWEEEDNKIEDTWLEKLSMLQFVSPEHLEIACLGGDVNVDELLKEPMEAVQSIDSYFSPFDKLQRVLAVYRGINKALTAALNAGSEKSEKLPSADDVLPSIILSVLRSRPKRLLWNLKLIESLSPSDYMRGEAGYAFTNLFGAVQFLKDLNLEHPDHLSISAQDFRKGLEECRSQLQDRIESRQEKESEKVFDSIQSVKKIVVPPLEVHKARTRGEITDEYWAQQFLNDNQTVPEKPVHRRSETEDTMDTSQHALPQGFTRSYTFLRSRPEDIKMSDLPKLLSEYRMLVHATETLLGEQATKASAERRVRFSIRQDELYNKVREIDPSLLPISSIKEATSFESKD